MSNLSFEIRWDELNFRKAKGTTKSMSKWL